MVLAISKGRGLKKRKEEKEKPKKRLLFYHVLQYLDPEEGCWYDEEISKDYGEVYRLKKELVDEIPEFKFRIIMRSTYKTWKEVENDFEQ